jgi:Tol biopolymer transport system component
VGNPLWLPDGGLLFERQALGSQVAGSRLERVDASGGNRQLVAQQAAFPALAPDGELLVFVRSAGTDRLIARPLAGGSERTVVDDPRFLALAFPRYSPDGAWIAFAATGGEIARAESGSLASLLQLGPRSARAHGLPWDVWLVRPDGTDLRRLTSFFDDDASIAWSPDGRWLVVYASEATQAVSADGSASYCLFGSGGFGALEWF